MMSSQWCIVSVGPWLHPNSCPFQNRKGVVCICMYSWFLSRQNPALLSRLVWVAKKPIPSAHPELLQHLSIVAMLTTCETTTAKLHVLSHGLPIYPCTPQSLYVPKQNSRLCMISWTWVKSESLQSTKLWSRFGRHGLEPQSFAPWGSSSGKQRKHCWAKATGKGSKGSARESTAATFECVAVAAWSHRNFCQAKPTTKQIDEVTTQPEVETSGDLETIRPVLRPGTDCFPVWSLIYACWRTLDFWLRLTSLFVVNLVVWLELLQIVSSRLLLPQVGSTPNMSSAWAITVPGLVWYLEAAEQSVELPRREWGTLGDPWSSCRTRDTCRLSMLLIRDIHGCMRTYMQADIHT